MKLHKLLTNTGPDVFYANSFKVVLESYLTYFRSHDKTRIVTISPHLSYKYEGDFYGLMDEIGIEKHYQWFVMLLNNFSCPGDYHGDLQAFFVPDLNELNLIKAIHTSKKGSF